MVHKFVFALSLLLSVFKPAVFYKLSTHALTLENYQPLTNINAFEANRGNNGYPKNLKTAENVKLHQKHFDNETFNKKKTISLPYADQATFNVNSSATETISLHSVLVNETVTEQNVQSMTQPDAATHLRKRKDIASNNTKYAEMMKNRHAKVSPKTKRKVRAVNYLKKYFRKLFPGDSRRNLQNLAASSFKKGSRYQKGSLIKRKVRAATKYPGVLEPILRKYFPEDFTTEENDYFDGGKYRKLSDLSILDRESRKRTELRKKSWTKRRNGEKTDAFDYEPFYFRAADEATQVTTSSPIYTKIFTIIVHVDAKGFTISSLTLPDLIPDNEDVSDITVSQTGTQSSKVTSTTELTTKNGGTKQSSTSKGTEKTNTGSTGTSETESTGKSGLKKTGTNQTDTSQSNTDKTGTTQTNTKPTAGGTKQTGTEQSSYLKGAPPIFLEKSEIVSSFKPDVNYHYHYHYFGGKKSGRK